MVVSQPVDELPQTAFRYGTQRTVESRLVARVDRT